MRYEYGYIYDIMERRHKELMQQQNESHLKLLKKSDPFKPLPTYCSQIALAA